MIKRHPFDKLRMYPFDKLRLYPFDKLRMYPFVKLRMYPEPVEGHPIPIFFRIHPSEFIPTTVGHLLC